MLLAEANQWPWDVRAYFGEGDECHMAFHFPLMPRIFMALRSETAEPIVDILGRTPAIPETCQWGLFLRNHDELTLEMVSEEERDYMVIAYARDPYQRLNLGIRRRLAPLVDNGRKRIELLNSLLFSLPGTPILYYGDEIGMGDDVLRPDRDGVRTPMQWSGGQNAGFSTATASALYSQPIADPVYGYAAVNVAAQLRDPSSLLHWMRNLIRLRKQFKVFGRGTLQFVPSSNPKILAYVRRWGDDTVLCVANVSRHVQPVRLVRVARRPAGRRRGAGQLRDAPGHTWWIPPRASSCSGGPGEASGDPGSGKWRCSDRATRSLAPSPTASASAKTIPPKRIPKASGTTLAPMPA
jgi:maltose alpha-D-glucosyltransferase/alpha-amylase